MTLPSKLICTGCGEEVPAADPLPLRCPRAGCGDGVDHVLRRLLDSSALTPSEARRLFLGAAANPFLRYRDLLHSHTAALAAGMTDPGFADLVGELDAAVATVDGRGFTATPFAPVGGVARALGLSVDSLWIKDETGNVAGSHKGRHLLGVAIWLEVQRRLGGVAARALDGRRLAIASCGNAALAAAVVARATGWPLDAFVPPNAHPRVLERLAALGVRLNPCPRTAGRAGDPCVRGFRRAVAEGALPFTCQGSENALVIEGGKTLAWEMLSTLLAVGRTLDHLFVQVGGGALASACYQALVEARELGVLPRLPRFHTVQSTGAAPLYRAWRRLVERLDGDGALSDADHARLAAEAPAAQRAAALAYAARHRAEFMWAWEEEPHSLAGGILDDETYDWLAVVEGMVMTGGRPLVVSEATLADAHRLAREHSGIAADATGTAGLAGLIELLREGEIAADETVGVLLTGVERS